MLKVVCSLSVSSTGSVFPACFQHRGTSAFLQPCFPVSCSPLWGSCSCLVPWWCSRVFSTCCWSQAKARTSGSKTSTITGQLLLTWWWNFCYKVYGEFIYLFSPQDLVFTTFGVVHIWTYWDVLGGTFVNCPSFPGVCHGWRTWRPLIRVIPIWTTVWWWTVGAAARECLSTLGLGTTETLMTCWTSSKWETRTANQWSWKSNQVCVEIKAAFETEGCCHNSVLKVSYKSGLSTEGIFSVCSFQMTF